MAQYRVNYTLLVGVVFGILVIAGGVYGIYRFQQSRDAERFLANANEAEAEGDLERARGQLVNYCMRRRDDKEAWERFARLVLEISEMPDASPKQRQAPLGALPDVLRMQPENNELRRTLIDLLMTRYPRPTDALQHINILLSENPKDGELQEWKMQAMLQTGQPKQREKAKQLGFKLIGYNEGLAEFEPDKAITPERPKVYSMLASLIRADRGDTSVADAVMDKLVERNPEMSEAYSARAIYRIGADDKEGGEADLEKALELDPQNVNALLVKAQQLIRADDELSDEENDERRKQAAELLNTVVEADPNQAQAYRVLASMERREGDKEAELARYDQGIEQADSQVANALKFYKAAALIDHGEIDAATAIITKLEEADFVKDITDYLRARIAMINNEHFKAAEEFKRLQPLLAKDASMSEELNLYLGLSRSQLGQDELALEAFKEVLQINPFNEAARQSIARIQAKLDPLADKRVGVAELTSRELAKPIDQQDWGQVFDEIERQGENRGLTESAVNLQKAEVYARRGMHTEARELVREALNENPDSLIVWRAALRLIATDPDLGPAVAIERLEKAVQEFGDLPILRLDKADFLMALGDDKLTEQLLALADDTDDWKDSRKVQLWKGLAQRFAQLGDRENREAALQKVVELAPSELPTLVTLFRAAIGSNDPQQVATAQKRILDLVGSKDDPTYAWTEATRLMWDVSRGEADKSVYDRADRLLEQALLKRPEWHELYISQGSLQLMRGEKQKAIESFDKALNLGPPNIMVLLQHVRLLREQGRNADALKAIERLDNTLRLRLFGKTYAETLLATGAAQTALEAAEKLVENNADNAGLQLWYGQLALRASSMPQLSEQRREEAREVADSALAKAVELAPTSPQVWLPRIRQLIMTDRAGDAEEALRNALVELPEDQAAPLKAQSYELLGRWFDAEREYELILERNPDNLGVTQALAAFYLSNRYPLPDKLDKAKPLINKLLRYGAENPEQASAAPVLWARRTGAELLAQTNDYQNILKAERLLATNAAVGISVQDMLQMAQILSRRPEPSSRLRAISLFEEVLKNADLSPMDAGRLGALYFSTDQWGLARRQMTETIARNPDVPSLRSAYIQMLLQRDTDDDLREAARELGKLQRLDPNGMSTIRLIVRVAIQLDKKREAINAVQRLIPRNASEADPRLIMMVAEFLADLDDLDSAEKAYRLAAQKGPAGVIQLALFLGEHRSVDEALDVLDKSREALEKKDIVATSLNIVAKKRSETGDKYDARLQEQLDSMLREDPESIDLLVLQAQLYDMQKQYDEAADVYRKLLGRRDLEGFQRALVLNNFGYLLALSSESKEQAEEAMGYVAEAVEILGPRADILDTRAAAHIALEQYDKAIEDLELAIIDSPTASMYFHMARAQLGAGNAEQAVEAWDKGEKLGLSRDTVSAAEREAYDQIESKINAARQSASLMPASRQDAAIVQPAFAMAS